MIENFLMDMSLQSFAPSELLQASSCDPSAEACEAGAALVRPDASDFLFLTSNYLIEDFLLLIAPIVAAIFFTNVPAGLEIIFLFVPAILVGYAYAIPFVLSLVYIIFGANFFLFSWVDNFWPS